MNFIYWIIQKFSQTIKSLYFSKVHVVGRENIPRDGPVIFCGNHANQFIDPIMIISYVPRQMSFTIAASSFSKPLIGDAARLLKAIPVKRPEDSKVKGNGKLTISQSKIVGIGTNFVEQGEKLGKGWSLLIGAKTIVVKTVIDKENLEIVASQESEELNGKETEYFVRVPDFIYIYLFSLNTFLY